MVNTTWSITKSPDEERVEFEKKILPIKLNQERHLKVVLKTVLRGPNCNIYSNLLT